METSDRVDLFLDVYGVASGAGGRRDTSALGPGRLRDAGLLDWLRRARVEPSWHDVAARRRHPVGQKPAFAAVEDICRQVAEGTRRSVERGRRFLVVGGDHSCAIGTWSGAHHALAARGPLGLVWVDAHMDSHVPETSPSGNLHGMPVAHLLGFGAPALTALVDPPPAIRPEHLCLIGVRSFEPEEPALLGRLGVRVIGMDEVRRRGFQETFAEALAIAAAGTAGYGVSLDLDVVDPREVPGVGSPVPHGVAAADLVRRFRGLGRRPGLVGLEIVEFNPPLDVDGATPPVVRRLVESAFAAGSAHDE